MMSIKNGNDDLHLLLVVVLNSPRSQFASSNMNDVNTGTADSAVVVAVVVTPAEIS